MTDDFASQVKAYPFARLKHELADLCGALQNHLTSNLLELTEHRQLDIKDTLVYIDQMITTCAELRGRLMFAEKQLKR